MENKIIEKKLPEDILKIILRPGNVIYDIIDTEFKYENKYHHIESAKK